MSYAPQPANLPSRTGPVILIVAGALAMILGPIIGIVMSVSNLMGTVDWQNFADAQQVANGSAADLPGNSEWMVVPDNGAQGYSCDVTGSNGELVDTRSREGIVTFTSTDPGLYTISCEPGGGTVVVMPAGNIDELIDNAPGAFSSAAVGFLVGFLGFVALIVGIIWLVRVNRDRRAAGGGGYPPPGGYGQGGYGQGGYGQGQQQWGPYSPPPPGQQPWGQGPSSTPPPPGQQPWGQGPSSSQSQTGQQPWGQPTPPSGPAGQPAPWEPGAQPRYGQNPTDPPRYGERIDPQDPND